MNRVVVNGRVGEDGVLRLELPLGAAEAGRVVSVTVEAIGPPTMTPEEWRRLVLSTAGSWQGDFERPPQGELEKRDPLS
jgi:hypothetical protein